MGIQHLPPMSGAQQRYPMVQNTMQNAAKNTQQHMVQNTVQNIFIINQSNEQQIDEEFSPSAEFVFGRKFGFTRTVTIENNQFKVCFKNKSHISRVIIFILYLFFRLSNNVTISSTWSSAIIWRKMKVAIGFQINWNKCAWTKIDDLKKCLTHKNKWWLNNLTIN